MKTCPHFLWGRGEHVVLKAPHDYWVTLIYMLVFSSYNISLQGQLCLLGSDVLASVINKAKQISKEKN